MRRVGGRAAGGRVVGGWSLGWWVVFGRLGGLWPGGRGAGLWLVSPDRWVGACGPSQAVAGPLRRLLNFMLLYKMMCRHESI